MVIAAAAGVALASRDEAAVDVAKAKALDSR